VGGVDEISALDARRDRPSNRFCVCSCFVRTIALSFGHAADNLTPADPRDLVISIAMALTSDTRLAKTQAAEAMANVVAERIVERLERDRFVILRRPPLGGHSAVGRG
jgi:hypothetical protein